MDSCLQRSAAIAILVLTAPLMATSDSRAGSPKIQFDMPAVTTAVDTSIAGDSREISFDLVVSSLIVDSIDEPLKKTPPIDHMLIRCGLRDRLPVVDFSPRTELQSDFAGPISITNKNEQSDSYGLSVDGTLQPFGRAHAGADESQKRSDSTQFQRQAPLQAVIASGTTDRGRGVYFKLRWTTQQVLEGEKHFRISFAVPESWRGGLVDVSVTANGLERSLFGPAKLKPVASRTFVVAVHQQNDPEAAEIAIRLAHLDQELTSFAKERRGSGSNPVTQFWRRVVQADSQRSSLAKWYQGVTSNQTDPYTDEQIQSLPMPVRVAVLGYTEAARELMELDDAG